MAKTYGNTLRAASPALTRRERAELTRPKRQLSAFAFIGPQHLSRSDLSARIGALHPGIGVVVRDYSDSSECAVRALQQLCRQQRRLLLQWNAAPNDAQHIPRWQRPAMRRRALASFSVHTMAEATRARRAKADLVFISPISVTQSHPGARALSLFQARRLARAAGVPAYALGGIGPKTTRTILACGRFAGVAGISAFLSD